MKQDLPGEVVSGYTNLRGVDLRRVYMTIVEDFIYFLWTEVE